MGVYIQDGTLFYLDPESPVRIPHFLAGVLMDWADVEIRMELIESAEVKHAWRSGTLLTTMRRR